MSQLATVSAFVEGAPPGEVSFCNDAPLSGVGMGVLRWKTDCCLVGGCHCW